MAFTTTPGASGSDFVGTAAVDSLFALNVPGTVSVEGLAGNDIIDVSNSTGTIGDVTVKGGEGNDTISFDGAGGTTESVISSSSVNGGAGNDNITLVGATSSKARGNEGGDNYVLSGNYTTTTINGNSGVDSFVIGLTLNASNLTLQSTKIHGGADNDGVMNFNAASANAIANIDPLDLTAATLASASAVVDIVSAVASTINGSKGVDNISIGNVTTQSGFEVRGGQGNDTIGVANFGADGILYAGDLGDDNISITAGDADASITGGDGIDSINTTGSSGDHTIDGGAGNDIVTLAPDEAATDLNVGAGTVKNLAVTGGDDTVTLGEGDDLFTAGTGNDTITGGAGADGYTVTANRGNGDADTYLIGALTDSAATLTGTTDGFDTITAGVAGFTIADGSAADANEALLASGLSALTAVDFTTYNTVDISAVANSLLGDTVTGTTTFTNTELAGGTALAASPGLTTFDVATFAALRTALNGQLTASTGAVGIQANTIVVNDQAAGAASNINGTYVIINNSNTGLDSGDLMFEVNVTAFTGIDAASDALNNQEAELLLASDLSYAVNSAATVNGIDIV